MIAPTGRLRVFIAGHRGMVGSALTRALKAEGRVELVTRNRDELDLARQAEVEAFFREERFDQVFLAAARVGGIGANAEFPAEFIHQNLSIECNVIGAAHAAGIQQLLFLGSSCVYPKFAAQPISESALLTGSLEPTNEPYAIAKIAGIKLCESFNRQFGRDYRSLMPANLYGPGDNFNLDQGHVIPALMRRFHEAAREGAGEVRIWGTGTPLREFLHVDDLADACRFVMEVPAEAWREVATPTCSHVNVGTGTDCSVREVAEQLAGLTGFRGRLVFDPGKPDGTPRKVLDVTRMSALGWSARIGLAQGLQETYEWYVRHGSERRGG